MNSNLLPIILAGGFGKRLWPISRTYYPKQFINLPDGSCLFEKTIENALSFSDDIVIITNKNLELHVDSLLKKYSNLKNKTFHILFESVGKNSGPAILCGLLFAKKFLKKYKKLLILPSDHLISDKKKFNKNILSALSLSNNFLITFGINPLEPSSLYGYVGIGNSIEDGFKVDEFIEKPPKNIAKKLIESKFYFWNSGIFLLDIQLLENEYKNYFTDGYEQLQNIFNYLNISFNKKYFLNLEVLSNDDAVSIDYMIFEKSKRIGMIKADFDWTDLGSWKSFKTILDKDQNNNSFVGNIQTYDSFDNMIFSSNPKKFIMVSGITNTNIIDTEDVLYISDYKNESNLKNELAHIKDKNLIDYSPVEYRPWGKYEVLLNDEGYKIKRITVNPFSSLSLQSHKYRNEHWVVVLGSADVIKGSEKFTLNYNESTFIRSGEKHRLMNNTNEICVIIETQSGVYLGEDDIVRFEDDYDR